MAIAEFATDNGIKTNKMFSPGYVWFDCERYGLDDNTQGKIGMHVVYRPLYGPDGPYAGNEVVTEEMMAETKKHYEAQRVEEERLEAEENKRLWEEIEASKNREPSLCEKMCCPKCGSICYGDCEA